MMLPGPITTQAVIKPGPIRRYHGAVFSRSVKLKLPWFELFDVDQRFHSERCFIDRLQREQNLLDRDIETVDLRLADRVVLRLSEEAMTAHKDMREELKLAEKYW